MPPPESTTLRSELSRRAAASRREGPELLVRRAQPALLVQLVQLVRLVRRKGLPQHDLEPDAGADPPHCLQPQDRSELG